MAIEWLDEAIVLDARSFGEHDAILHLFTSGHGRHAGLVKGAASRVNRPLLLAGNQLTCRYKARLSDQLGTWQIEPKNLHAGLILGRKTELMALLSACELVKKATAERESMPLVYAGLVKLMEALVHDQDWLEIYVRFEIMFLAAAGFALDLERCAVTGEADDLIYVSPRTGRAVSSTAGEAYQDRLLRLPSFLQGSRERTLPDITDGLRLTGHFLRRHIFEPADQPLPLSRERLLSSINPKAE